MEQLTTNTGAYLDEPGVKKKVETIQYIVIRMGKEQYGIDIRNVENIVRMQHITRVPKAAAYMKGVINLRGEVIPVMSLRLKMGLGEEEATKATRIIILKLETEGNVGIIVDEVKEVVTLDVAEIEKVAYNAQDEKANYISGIGKHQGELISLLEISAVTLDDNA